MGLFSLEEGKRTKCVNKSPWKQIKKIYFQEKILIVSEKLFGIKKFSDLIGKQNKCSARWAFGVRRVQQ